MQLEEVRVTKEQVKQEDEAAEVENKEANALQEKKDEMMKTNSSIDNENEVIQKQFLEITSERNKIVEKDKLLNAHYQVIHQNLESVCDERKNLRTISDSIDEEHHRLTTILDDMKKQEKDMNDFTIINIKKSFIKLQEDKVKLMQDDLILEQKQEKYQKEHEDFQKEKKNVIECDNYQLDLWEKLMLNFEKLKGRKQILLLEEFESNRKRKENMLECSQTDKNFYKRNLKKFQVRRTM